MSSFLSTVLRRLYVVLLLIFGYFALSDLHEEIRLFGKVVWMLLSNHRPHEAVLIDGFTSIYINLTLSVVAAVFIVFMESRVTRLAARKSPAEARKALNWPAWFETVLSFIYRMLGVR